MRGKAVVPLRALTKADRLELELLPQNRSLVIERECTLDGWPDSTPIRAPSYMAILRQLEAGRKVAEVVSREYRHVDGEHLRLEVEVSGGFRK